MSRFSWTVILRVILPASLVLWLITFIVYFKFPHLAVVHYISVGLVFLIVLLGILIIIQLISSRRLPGRQLPVLHVPPTQPSTRSRFAGNDTEILRPAPSTQPSTRSRLAGNDTEILRPAPPPPRIVRVLSNTKVFVTYLVLAAIFLALNGAWAYVRVNSCSLISDKRISVNGSTSLVPLVRDVVNVYQQACFGANVSVVAQSSLDGLQQVEKGSVDIGASDVFADLYQNPDLKDYQVAVVVFALVVNDSVNITNLTTDEVKGIYSGDIFNWHVVGNRQNLDVVLVSRPPDSHTRLTFENYVLDGGIETISGPQSLISDNDDIIASSVKEQPGAIGYVPLYYANKYHLKTLSIDGEKPQNSTLVEKDIYKFWNIEHMYTKGWPTGTVKDFVYYMFGTNAKQIISKDGYLDPAEFSRSVLITHVP